MRKGQEPQLRFRDYAREKIGGQEPTDIKLDIIFPNEIKLQNSYTGDTTGYGIISALCTEQNLDHFEIFSLQSVAGSIQWVNGRNRIDLQLSETNTGILHFRIKYFPDISILKMSTKRFLLWQIYDDYIEHRNGYETLPAEYFINFKETVKVNHKVNELLALISQDMQFGQYVLPIVSAENKLTGDDIRESDGKYIITNREGLTYTNNDGTVEFVKYGQLFGVSKPRKFKEALRMIIIDETISDDNDTAGIPIHFTFRTQKEASAAFRFVSEQYVFYSFEQVPNYMINGHRQDLGIQILDLFNPRQAQNYKTYQFDMQFTEFQLFHRARISSKPIYQLKKVKHGENRTITLRNEQQLLDSMYQVISSLTCHICYDEKTDTLLMPCKHLLLCNTCAEKCSQCPVCRIDIEERLQAFLPVDRDELDLKYRIITKSDRRKTF